MTSAGQDAGRDAGQDAEQGPGPDDLTLDSAAARALLRHHLAALAYRFAHAVRDVPDGFATYDPGEGVRTPIEQVRHVADVLDLAWAVVTETKMTDLHDEARWSDAVTAVHEGLERLDAAFRNPELDPSPRRIQRLLHGPLVDAGTHIGQLLVLRRLAGSPAAPTGYLGADVQIGRLGPDQGSSDRSGEG